MDKLRFWLAGLFILAGLLCYGGEEYYVGVATTIVSGERFNPATTWHYGIGWNQASGYDANEAAEQACNERAGVKCWPWLSSMQGGCIVLVEGTWTDQGREPLSELFSRSSTLGMGIARRDALHICEATIHSGKAEGTVMSWECAPRVTFCSADVGSDAAQLANSFGGDESPESTDDAPSDTLWNDMIRVPIVAYPDSGSYYWDTDGWDEEGLSPVLRDSGKEAYLFGCLNVYHTIPFNDWKLMIGATNYCDEPVIFVACFMEEDKPICRPARHDSEYKLTLLGKFNRGHIKRIKATQDTELLLAMALYSEQAKAQSIPFNENGSVNIYELSESQVKEIQKFTESLMSNLEAEFIRSR